MEIIILIDGTRRRRSTAYSGVFQLGKGVHFFVRSRGKWLRRYKNIGKDDIRILYREVTDERVLAILDNLWSSARRTTPTDDDVDFLQLELVLDVYRGTVYRSRPEACGESDVARHFSAERSEEYRKLDEALDHLDSVLDGGKTAFEFMKHLFQSAPKIRHALHLIVLGHPAGITSLLLIVFTAAGYTLLDDVDLETVSTELLKDISPRPLRISIEIWEAVKTSCDLGELVRDDRSLWLRLEAPTIRLRSQTIESTPVLDVEEELELDDDFGLSL